MSLGKALIVIGLAIGGYVLYTKFASQNNSLPQSPQSQAPQVQQQPLTQQQSNAVQVTNLGLDPTQGVGSVAVSSLGNASASDKTISDFVSTHDYGVFTKAAQQVTTIVPQFANRAAADAYYKSH